VLWVLVCSGGCEFVWVDSGKYMATVRVGGQWTIHGNSLCGWTVDSTWQQFVWVDSGQYKATVRVGG